MADDAVEVIYAAPPRTRAWWAAAAGALLFVALIAWIVARMVRNPVGIALVVVILVLGLVAPAALGQRGPLRATRVTADGASRGVRIEHRRGVELLRFDEVRAVEAREESVAEGVPIDVVALALAEGREVRFAVIDRGAAEGAARALKAVLGLDAPKADTSAEKT